MLRFLLTTAAVLSLTACEFGTMPVNSVRAVSPEMPKTMMPGDEVRVGKVTYELISSTCSPSSARLWDGQTYDGYAVMSDKEVYLALDTMPGLDGQLVNGEAQLTGEMEFMGETGVSVMCIVDGQAEVFPDSVEGVVTETLSSVGDVNCQSTAKYTLVFDE